MSIELDHLESNKSKLTQQIRELTAQISRLEDDKSKIEDWVKSKEKFVDELQKKSAKTEDEITKKAKDLESKKKDCEASAKKLDAVRAANLEDLHKLEIQAQKLELAKTEAAQAIQILRKREEILCDKEASVQERENFVESVFAGIAMLRRK
mgnify:CR=1 FL=1